MPDEKILDQYGLTNSQLVIPAPPVKQQTDRDDFFRHGRFYCHNSFVNPPLARARVKLITVSAYST